MQDKYKCICGSNMFEIHADFISCCSCKGRYRVIAVASPKLFNARRSEFQIIEVGEVNLKTGKRE
jgi:hypothetical protein